MALTIVFFNIELDLEKGKKTNINIELFIFSPFLPTKPFFDPEIAHYGDDVTSYLQGSSFPPPRKEKK